MTTARAYGGVSAADRRSERRRRLLDAGYTLLAGGGPKALTVTGVCAEAGLTARYFYEHFPNRDALMAAIVDAETQAVIEVVLAATRAAPADPEARALAAVRALLDTFDADPRRLQMTLEQDEAVLRLRAFVAARLTDALVAHAASVWPQADAQPHRVPLAAGLAVGGVLQMLVDYAEGTAGLSREELIGVAARFTLSTGAVVLEGG